MGKRGEAVCVLERRGHVITPGVARRGEAMWRGEAMSCHVIISGEVWRGEAWGDEAWCGEARRGEARRGVVRQGVGKQSEARRGEARRGEAKQCCVVARQGHVITPGVPGKARRGEAMWRGVAWRGEARRGVAWRGEAMSCHHITSCSSLLHFPHQNHFPRQKFPPKKNMTITIMYRYSKH